MLTLDNKKTVERSFTFINFTFINGILGPYSYIALSIY